MNPDKRLGCSSISFRHRPLAEALDLIAGLGFDEIDLGALPGVCEHVPGALSAEDVRAVAGEVTRAGLSVRSINADVGDLNQPVDAAGERERDKHIRRLVDLADAVGALAVVLPCGRQHADPVVDLQTDLDLVAEQLHRAAEQCRGRGVQLWVEALHSGRLCNDGDRAAALARRLDPARVGIVYDISHVVAVGTDPRAYFDAVRCHVVHVHLRDAVAGDIHRSIGRGDVDFADLIDMLQTAGYAGHFTLELETRDVAEHDRPAATAAAAGVVSRLLAA